MRTINSQLLKELVCAMGEQGKEKAALGAQVSSSFLEKGMAGSYKSQVRSAQRKRLCEFFGVAEGDLFPLVSSGRKRVMQPKAS